MFTSTVKVIVPNTSAGFSMVMFPVFELISNRPASFPANTDKLGFFFLLITNNSAIVCYNSSYIPLRNEYVISSFIPESPSMAYRGPGFSGNTPGCESKITVMASKCLSGRPTAFKTFSFINNIKS